MILEIKMPALSPTMTEGSIIKWRKNVGDNVKSGEVLMDVGTDKATMEYETVDEGILAKIIVPEGSNGVKVDDVICIFAESGETIDSAISEYEKNKKNKTPVNIVTKEESGSVNIAQEVKKVDISDQQNNSAIDKDRIIISPIAKRIAEEDNINISKITGTGPYGRIIKSDVLNFKENSSVASSHSSSSISHGRAEDSKIQISGMRKVIAERLTFSKSNIPHFYLNASCVVDDLLMLRKKINELMNTKITINDLIVKAVANAMMAYPEVNRSWNNDSITQYGNIDISIAVDIPDGLITPIVKNADKMRLSELSGNIKELVVKAKEGRLRSDEYQGGSITISNLGMLGVHNFSAIVNPPQASILSVGAVYKKPVVNENDEIKVKSVMEIGISADHRVVDGALCAKFLNEIKKILENPVLLAV